MLTDQQIDKFDVIALGMAKNPPGKNPADWMRAFADQVWNEAMDQAAIIAAEAGHGGDAPREIRKLKAGSQLAGDAEITHHYRGWEIKISHAPTYGSHPFEWHINKKDEKTIGGAIKYNDPTSWQTYDGALIAAREAIDNIEAHLTGRHKPKSKI